jgi:peptidoglycan hydrolase-like protein with peptidoglycan-binding domain
VALHIKTYMGGNTMLLKRKTVSFLLAVALFITGIGLVAAPTPAQAATCQDVLTKMTDPLALRMEAGETVIWDNVDSKLIAAKNTYVNLIKAKGWSITFESAYRPYQYQQHLYEIVQNKSLCQAEMSKHGLGTLVAAPSMTAPHTAGKAFDAVVRDEKGTVLNSHTSVNSKLVAVAAQANLIFPYPSTDGVHHILGSGSTGGDTLKVGDQGAAVVTLQKNLNLVGYSLTADGIFGSGTETAVKQFQSAHGLSVDGIVGSATSSKLASLASTTTVIRLNSTGDEVKVLQRLLTKKGYSVTASGTFNTATETAVKNFQKAKSLTVDGIVGSATWSKLRS